MTIKLTGNRLLAVYAGVLPLAVAAFLLSGAAGRRKSSFSSIDVQRINIVEPDGTVRLVLSSQALFPGILFKKKEYPHPINDREGRERLVLEVTLDGRAEGTRPAGGDCPAARHGSLAAAAGSPLGDGPGPRDPAWHVS